jgi:hypothetical protein
MVYAGKSGAAANANGYSRFNDRPESEPDWAGGGVIASFDTYLHYAHGSECYANDSRCKESDNGYLLASRHLKSPDKFDTKCHYYIRSVTR